MLSAFTSGQGCVERDFLDGGPVWLVPIVLVRAVALLTITKG